MTTSGYKATVSSSMRWLMLQANLSMDQSFRRSHHQTTLKWKPSWKHVGVGTPPSTWLSGPATHTASIHGKAKWSGSMAIPSCPSAPWSIVMASCVALAWDCGSYTWPKLYGLHFAIPARAYTQKTLSQTSGRNCQKASCCMAMTTRYPWQASLILTHGIMCPI